MAKNEAIEKLVDGSNGGPSVDFEERCTINLGDYQSLTIAVRYSKVSSLDDLAACQALLPKVITAVDADMGELIAQSLGNGVREDMKAVVLAAVAKLPAPKDKK